MSIAKAIFKKDTQAVKYYLEADIDNRDNIDEYGFTPLIETVITGSLELGLLLLKAGAEVDQPDVTGRTALHWASNNNNLEFCQLLLNYGADPNAYNRGGQPVLAFPVLRQNKLLQSLLQKADADLPFTQDFINTKLIGHRYQLTGCTDIVNGDGEFIEIDFEGFILEATVSMIANSLMQFRQHFVARQRRHEFNLLEQIISTYQNASKLLYYQDYQLDIREHQQQINTLLSTELLLLPVAYAGHAITFVRYRNYWAKIDRGENSEREGSVNIYHIGNRQALNKSFYQQVLYRRTSEQFVHRDINRVLELKPLVQLPISSQITGNCSWANVEATVAVMYFLLSMVERNSVIMNADSPLVKEAITFYQQWQEWDQDRALNECILVISEDTTLARKASKAAILAAILFQHCQYGDQKSMERAERILKILVMPEFSYILRSYVETYTHRRLSKKGNNLLHILDDLGISIPTGVQPIYQDSKKD